MLQVRAFLVISLLLTLVHSLDASCTGGSVDGCTTPQWTPHKGSFTTACNKHDVCYACGVKFGKSRRWCDRVFRNRMRASCRGSSCKEWAKVYFWAVRGFGLFLYKKSPENWCDQSWVRGCL